MSLMTDSKIIHQAQESQQFQQNPQYFHKNVNPDEVYNNINELSCYVNTFVKKFNHSNMNMVKKEISLLNKCSMTDKITVNSKSQIDQLAYQTQNFIQGLTWVNQSRKMSHSKNIEDQKIQSKVFVNTRKKSVNHKKVLDLSQKTLPISQSLYQTFDKKDFRINNSQEINSFKISHQKYPKTINIPRKKSSKIQQIRNQPSKFIISPFRGQKKLHHFDDFDDQDTVVNEPINKPKIKYYKKPTEKDIKSERVKNEPPYKLTKKKLLQKILNLQNTVNQLKFQKYQNQQIRPKNNILYFPVEIQSHERDFIQKINSKSVKKTQNKLQNNFIDQQKIHSQRFKSLNTKNYENLSQKNHENQINLSQPRAKSSLKNQDRKISLKKWVGQIW